MALLGPEGGGRRRSEQDRRNPAPLQSVMFCRGERLFDLFMCLSLFLFVHGDFFPPSSFIPDILFKLSQTPTPGNKNIVGFICIIFLFEIKMLWMS